MVKTFRAAGEIIRTNIHHRKRTVAMAGSALKKSYSGALFYWLFYLLSRKKVGERAVPKTPQREPLTRT